MPKLELTETGLPNYKVTKSHNDINGKWGGYKTWIVHYANDSEQKLALYTYLGWYWYVGLQSGEHHSRHEAASQFNELLRDGISPNWMYWLVRIVAAIWKIIKRIQLRCNSNALGNAISPE